MDQIVSHAKHRGFVFQGSEIYGGLANTWDYGPLGVELKNNIKKAWWKKIADPKSELSFDDKRAAMNSFYILDQKNRKAYNLRCFLKD